MAHVLEEAAGVAEDGPLAEAMAFRAPLLQMTQRAYEAALFPQDRGGLPEALRAALACRIARMSNEAGLAAHYAQLAGEDRAAALSDPASEGRDAREAALLAYVDRVTTDPANASEAEVAGLRDAGFGESDIVRLAGLVAFVNYQVRLATALRVMGQAG